MFKTSVFGLGPVGLVTAVCLARKGYPVLCVDSDVKRVRQVRDGAPPFFEPGLAEYLKHSIETGRFNVTTDPSSNAQSELSYITVGTPNKSDGSIDLTYVKKASLDIAKSISESNNPQIVVVKSTVIPGTTRNVIKPILERELGKKNGTGFFLCSNPEFLRQGNAIYDTEHPDRIVIGSDDQEASSRLERFYLNYYSSGNSKIIKTTFENAELIKYANNAFLATKISFINCIANIAELIPGADVRIVADGIGVDDRIGTKFLNAGLGWGGSCFPKDIKALISFSKSLDYEPTLIDATLETNDKQWQRIAEMCKGELGGLGGKRIAVLGLAFKPNTDDLREAVSIKLVRRLLEEKATIVVYDPAAMRNTKDTIGNTVEYARSSETCIDGSDCCIIVTEWDQFREIPPNTFVERMRQPFVIDGRRIYDPIRLRAAGVRLLAIGLGPEDSNQRQNT